MTFESWIPLALIPLAVAGVILLVRRKAWFARRKLMVGTAFALVAALLLAALAQPKVDQWRQRRPARIILLADASASMAHAQPWRQVGAWMQNTLADETELTVLPFAGRPADRTIGGRNLLSAEASGGSENGRGAGGQPFDPADINPLDSNLEQALRTAAVLAGGGDSRNKIIVYSDGLWISGDARAALEAVRRQGITVGALPAVKRQMANARLVDVAAPQRVEAGGTVPVRVVVQADSELPVDVVLSVQGNRGSATPAAGGIEGAAAAGGEIRRTVTLAGNRSQRVDFDLPAGQAGLMTVRVRVEMAGDAVSGDNQWQVPVQVGQDRPLLVVVGEADDLFAGQLLPQIAGAGPIRLLPSSQWPSVQSDLNRYRAVVLANVSAYELGASGQERLSTYVRQMGGGLAVLGGDSAFGRGRYFGRLIDDLLPVSSRAEHRPPVRLALVLDRSASMSEAVQGRAKLEVAKDAVLALEKVLLDDDRLSLVAFNHEPQVVFHDVSPAADWSRVRDAMLPVVPRGGTNLSAALIEAIGLLHEQALPGANGTSGDAATDRPRKHIIVVSDGESDPFDARALAAEAAAGDITISVIATRQQQIELLTELAQRGGGFYYEVAEMIGPLMQNRLAQTFMDDLPLEVMVTRPAAVRIFGRRPLWPDESERSAPDDVPAYMLTQAKPRATVHVAAGEEDHPLLASWRLGLGRAMAVTVPVDRPEAVSWLASAEVAAALRRGLHWLSSEAGLHDDFSATVVVEGGILRVEVESRRLSDEPEVLPEVALVLQPLDRNMTDAGEGVVRLPLDVSGPGRWQLTAPLSGESYSYALQASVAEGEQALIASGVLSAGIAAEFRRSGIDEGALAAIADIGGGALLRSPDDVAEITLPGPEGRPLWPLLLAVAALVMLGQVAYDVAGRRR